MATITIITSAAQDARIVDCFGAYLTLKDANGVKRNATGAEVKAWLIQQIQNVVQTIETNRMMAVIEAPPLGIT